MDNYLDQQALEERYQQLGLPVRTVELLRRYFAAMAHFYGIINLKDAFNIINSQNPNLVTFEELDEFSLIIEQERDHYFYIIDRAELWEKEISTAENREIISDYLLSVDDDDYYELSNSQNGKPFYVPEKDELLRYEDEYYYEVTPKSKAVEQFFTNKKHLIGESLHDIMAELVCTIVFNRDIMDEAFLSIASLQIDLTDKEVIQFGNLYCDWANNFRIPHNRGFTPIELHKMVLQSKISTPITPVNQYLEQLKKGEISDMECRDLVMQANLPAEITMDFIKQIVHINNGKHEKVTVSQNAPCPCGSGKKYKRCCGKKE